MLESCLWLRASQKHLPDLLATGRGSKRTGETGKLVSTIVPHLFQFTRSCLAGSVCNSTTPTCKPLDLGHVAGVAHFTVCSFCVISLGGLRKHGYLANHPEHDRLILLGRSTREVSHQTAHSVHIDHPRAPVAPPQKVVGPS